MNIKVKVILSALVSIFLIIPIYIILHECGHSLVAMLCGAKITKFSVLDAYMSYEGGTFSLVELALFHAAGMLIPLFVSIIYMLIYRTEFTSIPYRIFSLVSVFSLITWVFVPTLYLFGNAPINDDVTKFINSSSIHPMVVMFVASIILICCIFIAYNKKIIQYYWSTISTIK